MSKIFRSAVKVSLIYAVFGAAWIAFSDAVLEMMVSDPQVMSRIQTIKGWLYVAVTSALLFLLVRRALGRIEHINRLDPLTKLSSHYLFAQYLSDLLQVGVAENARLVLIYVNIDGFKQLNRQEGYEKADQLLCVFSEALRENFRAKTLLGRLGPDQFGIAMETDANPDKKIQAVRAMFDRACDDVDLELTCSMGVALYPDDAVTADQLMTSVAVALSDARASGAGQVRYFNKELSQQELERFQLVKDLERAIDQQELFLVYQPQYTVNDGSICGVEVLVRWQHEERGFVPPDVFIPLAEQHHLVSSISEFVIRQANLELATSGLLGAVIPRVSVNVSAAEFSNEAMMKDMVDVLCSAHEIYPYLQLEITETAALNDLESSVRLIKTLKKGGLKFSIDDFGTGFSSLAMLKDLPIDEIKIDKSFVGGLPDQERSAVIVEAVLSMARSFGIGVVAEGVETEEQLAYLRRHGCHQAQGYLLNKPMRIAQLLEQLATRSEQM